MLAALIALLPLALAAPFSPVNNNHQSLTRRQAFSGEATFYAIHDSAPIFYCDGSPYYSEDQPIVALDINRMNRDPGGPCNKWITVSYQGATTRVQVKDACVGCGYNDVDLSPGAIKKLRPDAINAGRFPVTWWFDGEGPQDGGNDNGGGNNQPTTTTEAPPTPTYEPPAPTSEQPAPTSEQPAPTSEQPAPTSEQPAPTSEQPAPTSEQPAPTSDQPAPTSEQPVPTSQQPAPTSSAAPVDNSSPAPVQSSSAPDNGVTSSAPPIATSSAPALQVPNNAAPSAASTSAAQGKPTSIMSGGKPVQCRRRVRQ